MNTTNSRLNTVLDMGDGITMIVITGGPCSGKTTGLARLTQMLSDRGYKVLVSPESATKLISAGMRIGELSEIDFQEEILLDTLSQEERIISVAKRYRDNGCKVVVLCDRGAMDGEAYVGPDTYDQLIRRMGFTHRSLCDERYHAAIHLRTAALGAEQFYTLANNETRTETLEQARSLDDRTLAAWTRHKHPRVIDNSTNFEGKIHRLFEEVCAVLGDPVPIEKEDKFLIKTLNPDSILANWTESLITQDYLVSPADEQERRVRARGDKYGTSYYYTVKREIATGVRTEVEKLISEREYQVLLTLRDPKMVTVKKRRICFFWKEQFFEVDLFMAPRVGLAIMEAERTDRNRALEIPPFIEVVQNVTGDREYSNASIARTGGTSSVATRA